VTCEILFGIKDCWYFIISNPKLFWNYQLRFLGFFYWGNVFIYVKSVIDISGLVVVVILMCDGCAKVYGRIACGALGMLEMFYF